MDKTLGYRFIRVLMLQYNDYLRQDWNCEFEGATEVQVVCSARYVLQALLMVQKLNFDRLNSKYLRLKKKLKNEKDFRLYLIENADKVFRGGYFEPLLLEYLANNMSVAFKFYISSKKNYPSSALDVFSDIVDYLIENERIHFEHIKITAKNLYYTRKAELEKLP